MTGIFAGQVIADGQLPNAQASIYAAPALMVAYIKLFSLANTGGGTENVQLFLNSGGTPRLWKNLQLLPGYTADILEAGESLELQAGASIEAVTTTAVTVDFALSGVVES